jgi:hypothetical protein
VIGPEQASKLLDDVIYERVLKHIDIEGLHAFELELWVALQDCGIESDIAAKARELIDHALARFRDDPVRSMEPFGGCELCEEEALAHARPAPRRNGARRARS